MRALVAGTVSLDLLAPSAASPTACATTGSTAANVAIRLAIRGWEVELVGLIGDDGPGRLVRSELEGWGVKTPRLMARPGAETPIVYQVHRQAGDPFLRRCPRCSRPQARHRLPSPHELDAAGAEKARLDVAFYDCGGEAEPYLRSEATERGALVWAELSALSNADPLGMETLRVAWARKCSSEDEHLLAELVSEIDDDEPLTIVTLGEQGIRFLGGAAGSTWRHMAASPVAGAVIDSIGAGDAFTASCIDGLTTAPTPGAPTFAQLGTVFRRALDEAALVVTRQGANGDLARTARTAARDVQFACASCGDYS